MAHGRVTKGGWRWNGQSYEQGDRVEAPPAQIRAWAAAGYVEAVVPERAPDIEAAVASGPRENAAERTGKPIKHLGGGWYEVGGEKVQGRTAAEKLASEG